MENTSEIPSTMKTHHPLTSFHGKSSYLATIMIQRPEIFAEIERGLRRAPVVVVTGPRQVGKTTIARQFVPIDDLNYFDLEDPASLARLSEPMTALRNLSGLVVIDEVQRRPDLFPILRVLVDRPETRTRFLILGSASGELLRQSSESLAGRTERIAIGGFTLDETGYDKANRLWLRGGFPPSYLAENTEDSIAWRRNFITTMLERDFPQWGVQVAATRLLRFWNMLAHYHGGIWNGSEIARALETSESTARRYLDLLGDALVVLQLQPHFVNIKKRQVKSPKIYVRDSGLLHRLLGIDEMKDLVVHPKVGASWEGFVIEQVLSTIDHDDAWFWGTHQGAEIDLLLRRGDRMIGIECKRSDAPKKGRSMQIARDDLELERLLVLYPGTTPYPLDDRIDVVPLQQLADPRFDPFR